MNKNYSSLDINSNINSLNDEIVETNQNPQESDLLLQTNESNVEFSRYDIFKGLIYSSLSALFFSLCSLIVKYLNDLSPSDLATFRFLGIFLLSLPQIAYNQLNPFGPRGIRYLLFLLGVVGGFSLLLRFYCIHYLPISEASVIIFSFPVVVAIFAKIFLKEPFGRFQSIMILITIIGLILITRLPLIIINSYAKTNSTFISNTTQITPNTESFFDQSKIIGISTGMLSTVFIALTYILLAKVKIAHTSVITFNFGWVGMIEMSIAAYALKEYKLPVGLFDWSLIALLAVFSYCGQLLLAKSLKIEKCSPIAVIRASVDILLCFLYQYLFFNEDKFDIWSISGSLSVTLCIILLTFRKYVISLPEDSPIRIKLNFITR